MQTFLVTFVMLFCTKLEILISCRLFRKNPACISAQNLKMQIYADFFGQFKLAFLHENAILNFFAENTRESQQKTLHESAISQFMQKTPANRNKKLCTKTQFRNPCRKHPRIAAKTSARNRNSAIFAENAREAPRRRPDLLQSAPASPSKLAILHENA